MVVITMMNFTAQAAAEYDHRQLQIRRDLPEHPCLDLKKYDDIKQSASHARKLVEEASASLVSMEAEVATATAALDEANAGHAALVAQADTGWAPSASAVMDALQATVNAKAELEILERACRARESLLADRKAELFPIARSIMHLALRVERSEALEARKKRIEAEADEERRIDATIAARSEYEAVRSIRDADLALRRYGM